MYHNLNKTYIHVSSSIGYQYFFQYTVTGDISCMECMIYDSLFVYFSLCINVCDFIVIWGWQEDNPNVVMLLPPFPQVYKYMLLMYYYSICTKSGIGKYISCILIYRVSKSIYRDNKSAKWTIISFFSVFNSRDNKSIYRDNKAIYRDNKSCISK